MKSNDAAKGDDYFLMWINVEYLHFAVMDACLMSVEYHSSKVKSRRETF
jgi:hypothetical protein